MNIIFYVHILKIPPSDPKILQENEAAFEINSHEAMTLGLPNPDQNRPNTKQNSLELRQNNSHAST